jgi:hypothetical protein
MKMENAEHKTNQLYAVRMDKRIQPNKQLSAPTSHDSLTYEKFPCPTTPFPIRQFRPQDFVRSHHLQHQTGRDPVIQIHLKSH